MYLSSYFTFTDKFSLISIELLIQKAALILYFIEVGKTQYIQVQHWL